MIVRQRLLGTLKELFRSAAGTMTHASAPEPKVAEKAEPTIPVYQQTTIKNPQKHIQELAAAKRPYANVHFDVIE